MRQALAIAAILLVFGIGYVLVRGGEWAEPEAEVTTPSEELELTTETLQEETESYVFDVKYPQFEITAIDADIRSKVEAAHAEFSAYPPNPPDSAVAKNEFTGSFEDVYVGPDIVSVRLILSQYTGGAHPNTLFSGLNYERATGRQLLPGDAFALVGMTVEDVAEHATDELREKLGDSFFEEGANSTPENFSSFIVSRDSVTFIFQQYQVAPYAAGPQEVTFLRAQ